MYTLYCRQPSSALRWLADMPTEERARALASAQSKYHPQPVVIVRRFEDEGAGVVATFRGGLPEPRGGIDVPNVPSVPASELKVSSVAAE